MIRIYPALDILRVQDVGLMGKEDPEILEWAAKNERILLTHDVATITFFAYERVKAGLPMPGVFEVGRKVSIQTAIQDLLLLAECSIPGEWEGQIQYLPLK